MNFNEYQKAALFTANTLNKEQLLENGILGLFGEGGEISDIYKKHKFQGHKLDKEHIKEEIGDVLWYVSILSESIGVSLEDVAMGNINKLKKRYPNGFDVEKSINREV